MIRLPSFFKRKTQADDLELGSVGGRRTTKKPAPRSFQRAAEAEELALTEDPEQQRARHRLIGAAVLVLIAVIGLPRILDSKPKSAPNDIAVNIVTSLPIPGAEPKPEVKAEEKPKAEAPVESPKAAPAPEVKAETRTEPKPETKSASPAPSKASGLGLAAGEEVVAASSAKPAADDAAKSASANNATSNKYYILLGAYASEDNVKGAVAKLKGQKIPYSVLNKTGNDGAKLSVVRAGPFADKDAAQAAEKKIKAMSLPTKLVVIGKQ